MLKGKNNADMAVMLILGGHSAPETQANVHHTNTENAPTTYITNPLINRSKSTDFVVNSPLFK